MNAIVAVLALAVAVLGVLVVGLLRSHAEVLRSLHQLGLSHEGGVGGEPRRRTHPRRGPRRARLQRASGRGAGGG